MIEPGEPTPGAEPEPAFIKQMTDRRSYDLLLLVPFLCIGTSIGTVMLSTGLFRHLALVCAIGTLVGWVRAGQVSTERAHGRWLLVMWVAAALFALCAVLTGAPSLCPSLVVDPGFGRT